MTTLLIIYAVVAFLLIGALASTISVLKEQADDFKMKAERYEELYHDLMNNIDKHLY